MNGLEVRIGDAERDEAVELLRDHVAAGRINYDEFDERMTAALQSRTKGDLLTLFIDLPGRKPGEPVRPAPVARPAPRAVPATPPKAAVLAVRMLAPMMLLLPILVVVVVLSNPAHLFLFGPLLMFILLGRGTYAVQRVSHTPHQGPGGPANRR